MEHKIVISGEGSAHPKLGVKKKNSVEENLKILNEMIESGKLSLDHAIAKTCPGGTLRGVFNCCTDETMVPHVDALYDFVVAYKKRLVPDYDPKAPVKKVKKDKEYDGANKQPQVPVVEAAKSGRATCKISQEKIEKDELRVGLPVFARGQQVTAWAKASEFSKALRFETAPDNQPLQVQGLERKDHRGRDKIMCESRLGRGVRGEFGREGQDVLQSDGH